MFQIIGGILFVALIYIGYFLQLIIYPFYWIIVYADIVYLSIITFFILFISGIYILKKYYRLSVLLIGSLIFSASLILGCSAYFEASLYIKKVAEEKYHTNPTWIKINLNKWTDLTLLGHPHYGSSHAEIKVGDEWYHWSFKQRDFVND
jgi:hypothetical protein